MARHGRKQSSAAVIACVAAAGWSKSVVAKIPPAQNAGVPGMCFVPGFDYAPRWSTPDSGVNSPSQGECAQACLADSACSGATWVAYQTPSDKKKNCWFKQWPADAVAIPCRPEPGADATYSAMIKSQNCATIAYMAGNSLTCKEESALPPVPKTPAEAPAGAPGAAAGPAAAAAPLKPLNEKALATLMPPFKAFPNLDWGAADVQIRGGTPVTDLASFSVATEVECAQQCMAFNECNAAVWMGANPAWTGTQNCFVREFKTECLPPPDARKVPGAYLLLAQEPECMATFGPAAAPGAAPRAAPLAATPATATPVTAAAPLATSRPARAPVAATADGNLANSASGTGQSGSAGEAAAPADSGSCSLQPAALAAAGVGVLVALLA